MHLPALARVGLLSSVLLPVLGLADGFVVTKNVNSGKPPVEKVVLFAKDRPADHITFGGKGTGTLSFGPDGAIVSTIEGREEAAPRIGWRPGDGRPAAFDVADYTYLILACRLEGHVKDTNAKGQVTEKRPANMWFSANLYNAANERIGGVSLADVHEGHEGVTPAETVTLRIPLVLFRGSGLADKRVVSIGTDWHATAPTQSRAFRWVIDRIALAD